MTRNHTIDVLTATASDLRKLLDSEEVSSVELVGLYLDQIAKHNKQGLMLNAMISTASADRVLEEARMLDTERSQRRPRSKLHGIPIILKDLICTPTFGLETTAGSLALKGLNATEDAPIATLLREAGFIVIGKSNLSEWANSKGFGVTSGWSAVGGQTQSPYVKGGVDSKDRWMGHSTPAGSSSGSAVTTAAGFAALTIGSEADGSIVQPAIRAAAYSLEGTVGDVIMKGTQSGGAAFDSAGPIAKSTEDCADVMDILLPGWDFGSHLAKSWNGIRIAYLDYKTCQFPDSVCEKTPAFDTQHEQEMLEALKKVESLGAQVTYNAPLLSLPGITDKYKTVTMGEIGRHQLAFVISRFLGLFNNPQLRTLQDLVMFNKEHAAEEVPPEQPSQQVLENGLNDNMTDEQYHSGLAHLRQSVRHAAQLCLDESNADVIMASGETLFPSIAACAGYPIGSVPLGFSAYNGRPFGMEIMIRNGEEEKVFQVMSAWEATFPEARQPPPLLVNWATDM
ncbi:uncharacterized protein N7482_008395 [Penicillium canariense]|uniref:Amidase domain-containing protein n=1 Tax=Penicillium canariense TaxID=189055 RepID=A0A9W9HVX1_9EURO|nr:uncharacterized protein N7482_008395 [Penicillium canariense]KAJ5157295.1 hypothetical protein N7482_008395 [Penicillium canariense]